MTQGELQQSGSRVWSIDGDTVALLFSLHQWGARARADKSEMSSDADKTLLM